MRQKLIILFVIMSGLIFLSSCSDDNPADSSKYMLSDQWEGAATYPTGPSTTYSISMTLNLTEKSGTVTGTGEVIHSVNPGVPIPLTITGTLVSNNINIELKNTTINDITYEGSFGVTTNNIIIGNIKMSGVLYKFDLTRK